MLTERISGGARDETLRALVKCRRLEARKHPSGGHYKKIDLTLVSRKSAQRLRLSTVPLSVWETTNGI